MSKLTAVVTGASSGIGKCIAERLAEENYQVLGVQRRPPGIHADLSDTRQTARVWQQIIAGFDGPPNLLILNAGRSLGGLFISQAEEEIFDTINLNLFSSLLLCQAAIRTWVEEEKTGHVIFIGSQAALPGAKQTGNIVYTASKAAIHGIIGPLAHEYGPLVRVNAIAPGDIDTPMYDDYFRRQSQSTARDYATIRKEVSSRSALKRMVLPEEIASTVLFLENCNAMTGSVINVSAGASIH